MKTITNFSKSKRRSYLTLDLINAVFSGIMTDDMGLLEYSSDIIELTVEMKTKIIGQSILKLPEKKYNQYIGLIEKLKKELNKHFPDIKTDPIVISNVLLSMIEHNTDQMPDGDKLSQNLWFKLSVDLYQLFNIMQETESTERKGVNWENHLAQKGDFISKKFIEIIEE